MILNLWTLLLLLLSSSPPYTLSLSPLVGTTWKVNLDVGLQPGTWMPKRYPGWAESGARLGLTIEIECTSQKSSESEFLVGPKDETYVLQVTSPNTSFVSERGTEEVSFKNGGWCVQRPQNSVKNASGNLVKPQGLLRFWLDCPTGAKRRDVEIPKDTRIFFTTGVWDDVDTNYQSKSPNSSEQQQQKEYESIISELEELKDSTREIRNKSEKQNIFQNIASFRDLVNKSKEFDRLKVLKETYEQEMPPLGSAVASNGVQIAPSGSLVIKGNSTPDWLPGSEYLILGTFQTQSVEI